MPEREILVDASPGEVRVAILENGRLEQILMDRIGQPRLLGATVLAPVTQSRRDLGAVFLDLGAQDGFLEKFKGPAPTEGENLIVQVTAEPHRAKAARVTLDPVLSGAFLDLTPTRPGHAVARAITAKTERARLREIIDRMVPETMGVLVHAHARDCDSALLEDDARTLLGRWSRIQDRVADQANPRGFRILEPAPDALARARRIAPDATVNEGRDGALFRERDIDGALIEAMARHAPLPGGGTLVIDETEALVAIDIDAGGDRAATDNPDGFAAEVRLEIARQIRLRRLAGLILIDFPRIAGEAARRALVAALEPALSRDGEAITIHGWTRAGLLEITRARREPTLLEVLGDIDRSIPFNPTTLALEALRRVRRETSGIARPRLLCPNSVKLALQGPLRPALDEVEASLGGPLTIEARDGTDAIEIMGDPRS